MFGGVCTENCLRICSVSAKKSEEITERLHGFLPTFMISLHDTPFEAVCVLCEVRDGAEERVACRILMFNTDCKLPGYYISL
jgi:hypothetical protein